MNVRTTVASAVVVIALIALLFTITSGIVSDTEGDATDEGEKYNNQLDCMFGNPGETQKCRESSSLNKKSGRKIWNI